MRIASSTRFMTVMMRIAWDMPHRLTRVNTIVVAKAIMTAMNGPMLRLNVTRCATF